jgi:F-type H+-transporting ATPase subunit alpha
MEIKADEITKIIREEIEGYRGGVEISEIGSVISVGDGIARVYGLEKAMAGELLEFPHGVMGLASIGRDSGWSRFARRLHRDSEGDQVRRTRRIMEVPVGEVWWAESSMLSPSRSTERPDCHQPRFAH